MKHVYIKFYGPNWNLLNCIKYSAVGLWIKLAALSNWTHQASLLFSVHCHLHWCLRSSVHIVALTDKRIPILKRICICNTELQQILILYHWIVLPVPRIPTTRCPQVPARFLQTSWRVCSYQEIACTQNHWYLCTKTHQQAAYTVPNCLWKAKGQIMLYCLWKTSWWNMESMIWCHSGRTVKTWPT